MRLPYVVNGVGVVLRSIELADAERCVNWLHNPETTRYLLRQYNDLTLETEIEWIKRVIASDTDLVAAICVLGSDGVLRHVGNVGIHQIDRVNGHAEIGIFIGDQLDYGKGVGREALRAIITHAFRPIEQNGVGLARVWARVCKPNKRSRRMCMHLNLKLEGVLRSHVLHPTEGRLDECLYGILASEWND